MGKKLLGIQINTNLGFPSVELDEIKIISNREEIYWMFWIIDRNIKEARVRCVLNNRTKQKLLAIFNKYVSTNAEEDPDLEEEESVKTRVYSDSFSSYQVRDFQANRYILKRINHSVWFGIGINHTNTIESLWHNIKNITDNFSGLSIDSIKKDLIIMKI